MEVCDKMKRSFLLLFVLFLIFQLSIISAEVFATIEEGGLTIVEPESALLVNNIVCGAEPLSCSEGKIVSVVQGKTLNDLAKISPESARAILINNKVEEYLDSGAKLENDLQLDEEGNIISGSIQFFDKEVKFNDLIKEIEGDIFGKNVKFVGEEESSLINFNQGEGYAVIKGDRFENIKPGDSDAYLKLNRDGNIIEADLTASDDTSFIFDNRKIDIKKGTRVIYNKGVLNVWGKSGEALKLSEKITDGDKFSFLNEKEITLGENLGNRILIEGNKVKGLNFKIDDLEVKSVDWLSKEDISPPPFGEVSIVDEGFLLGKNTIGVKKGLSFSTGRNLLITESSGNLDNYEDWVVLGENKLKAEGSDFEISFLEGNPYAKVDEYDNFQIRAKKNFSLELENRDSSNKIPKMIVGGDFILDEDNKAFYTQNREVLIKKSAILGSGAKDIADTSTSPVELLVKDSTSENGYRDESYIISNFKGIATVPYGEQTGISDERYAQSIYKKKASTDLRYNYPTIEEFERITGKKLSFKGREIKNPEVIRTLIDVYEQNPDMAYEGTISVKIIGKEEDTKSFGAGFYDPLSKELYITTNEHYNLEQYESIIHEAGHGIHYQLNQDSFIKKGDQSGFIDGPWVKSMSKPYKDIDYVQMSLMGNTIGWDYTNKDILNYKNYLENKGLYKNINFPYGGFIRPYGSSNIQEDIATFREKVVGDPGFFQRYELIDENSQFYNPTYKTKIDLLLEYGFITQDEYNAVFNPQEYLKQ